MDKLLASVSFGLLSWFSNVPAKHPTQDKAIVEQSDRTGPNTFEQKGNSVPENRRGESCYVESSSFGWTKKNGKLVKSHSSGPSISKDCTQKSTPDPFENGAFRQPIQLEEL